MTAMWCVLAMLEERVWQFSFTAQNCSNLFTNQFIIQSKDISVESSKKDIDGYIKITENVALFLSDTR